MSGGVVIIEIPDTGEALEEILDSLVTELGTSIDYAKASKRPDLVTAYRDLRVAVRKRRRGAEPTRG